MMIFRALIDHKVLTAKEVADHLRVSTKTIYRWTKSGELHPLPYPGRIVVFLEREVEAFILRQKKGGSNGVADS